MVDEAETHHLFGRNTRHAQGAALASWFVGNGVGKRAVVCAGSNRAVVCMLAIDEKVVGQWFDPGHARRPEGPRFEIRVNHLRRLTVRTHMPHTRREGEGSVKTHDLAVGVVVISHEDDLFVVHSPHMLVGIVDDLDWSDTRYSIWRWASPTYYGTK